jgi:delta-1-pyrroline-5-carboxylate synthetase
MAKTDCGIGDVRRQLRLARRIVIKAGTPVLTHVDGNIALGRIGALVEQIAQLRNEGRDVVLVTSGAISTGTHRMRRSMTLSRSIQDSVGRQPPAVRQEAAAAVGQSLLMSMYENLFSKYNMSCAQVLITEDDLKDTETLAQVCDATLELLGLGLVPIVNDNDAVTSRTTSVFSSATNEVQ